MQGNWIYKPSIQRGLYGSVQQNVQRYSYNFYCKRKKRQEKTTKNNPKTLLDNMAEGVGKMGDNGHD